MLALAFIFVYAGCKDDLKRAAYDGPEGQMVSFRSEKLKDLIEEGQSSISVPLYRGNVEGPLEVALIVKPDSVKEGKVFVYDESYKDIIKDIPSSVSFADGQNVANINLTIDQSELDFTKDYKFSISISDEVASLTAIKSMSFVLAGKVSFEKMGDSCTVESGIRKDLYGKPTPYKREISFASAANFYQIKRLYQPWEPEEGEKDADIEIRVDRKTGEIIVPAQPSGDVFKGAPIMIRSVKLKDGSHSKKEGNELHLILLVYVDGVGQFGVFNEVIKLP